MMLAAGIPPILQSESIVQNAVPQRI